MNMKKLDVEEKKTTQLGEIVLCFCRKKCKKRMADAR